VKVLNGEDDEDDEEYDDEDEDADDEIVGYDSLDLDLFGNIGYDLSEDDLKTFERELGNSY